MYFLSYYKPCTIDNAKYRALLKNLPIFVDVDKTFVFGLQARFKWNYLILCHCKFTLHLISLFKEELEKRGCLDFDLNYKI